MKFADLYNKLVYEVDDNGQFVPVRIDGLSRGDYNSLRVQLVRKFTAQADVETALGIDRFSGMYMACSFVNDRTTNVGVATFCVRDKETSRCQRKTYNVVDI